MNPTTPPGQSTNEDATEKYVDCPYDCGETVTAIELPVHLDLHVAEGIALDEDESVPTPFQAGSPVVNEKDSHFDYEGQLDLSRSRKSGKRGADRPPAQVKPSKPGRTQIPTGTIGPDGATRLGVFHPSLHLCLKYEH